MKMQEGGGGGQRETHVILRFRPQVYARPDASRLPHVYTLPLGYELSSLTRLSIADPCISVRYRSWVTFGMQTADLLSLASLSIAANEKLETLFFGEYTTVKHRSVRAMEPTKALTALLQSWFVPVLRAACKYTWWSIVLSRHCALTALEPCFQGA